MSEFEDKISKILSSPEDMEKIMGMARSLSGASDAQEETDGGDRSGSDAGSIMSALGNIDPKIFRLLTRALGEYSSKSNDKTALISAIRPYLKEDRRQKIDKATEIAKLARIARVAFSEFSGGDSDV